MNIGGKIVYRRRSRFSLAVVPVTGFVKGRTVWIPNEPGGERSEYICTGKGDQALPMHEYLTVFPRAHRSQGVDDRYRALFT